MKEGEGLSEKELDALKKSKEKDDLESRVQKIEDYLNKIQELANKTPYQSCKLGTWLEIGDLFEVLKSKKD